MSTREFTWTPLSFINDAADKLGFGQLFSHFLIFYFVLLFLHLLVSLFFLFLFFHPVLAWRIQKLSTAIVAKHVFFLFGYVCEWGDLFSLQRNHFGVKKGHFMLRHTHLLIYCFGHVFLLLPCCVGLPHLKHIRLKLPHHIRRGHQVRILKSNWNFEPYKLHQWCQRASQVTKRHLARTPVPGYGRTCGGVGMWQVWVSKGRHIEKCLLAHSHLGTGVQAKWQNVTWLARQNQWGTLQSLWQILSWPSRLVPGYGRTKPVTNPKLTIASRTWVRPYKACDKS